MFPVKAIQRFEGLKDIDISGKQHGVVLTYDAYQRKYVLERPFKSRGVYSVQDLADVRVVEVDDGYHLSFNMVTGYWETKESLDGGLVDEVIVPVTHDFGDLLTLNDLEDVYAFNPVHNSPLIYDAHEGKFVGSSELDGGAVGESLPSPIVEPPKVAFYFTNLKDVNISEFRHGELVVYDYLFNQWITAPINGGVVGDDGIDPRRIPGGQMANHGDIIMFNAHTGKFELTNVSAIFADMLDSHFNDRFDDRLQETLPAILEDTLDSDEVTL